MPSYHLKYSGDTGHLLYSGDGHLVNLCAGTPTPTPTPTATATPTSGGFPGAGWYCVKTWVSAESCEALACILPECQYFANQAGWDLAQFGVCRDPDPTYEAYYMYTTDEVRHDLKSDCTTAGCAC